jgi:hypothetical protein
MEITIDHYVLNEQISKKTNKRVTHHQSAIDQANKEDQVGAFHMLQSKASEGS